GMSASGILSLPEVDGIDEGNRNDEVVGDTVACSSCSSAGSISSAGGRYSGYSGP
nr:hypothetical protein [Tanacetum cinerariifolium]